VEGILINLFSNAIKFSDETKRLIIRLKKQPHEIFLEVTDFGIGIPPEELPHIFNRFYRIKQAVGFNAKGSGLGLTLVKHAAEAHHWQIEVKSDTGKGSSFIIHRRRNR
jgi:two-component system phosphate regulon sensor histidine kinase PhoR